jgi:hypothetical protein
VALSTKYASLVERFLSHYYPALRNAPHPKEVAKVVLESIEGSVVPLDNQLIIIYLGILLARMQNCMLVQKGK